MFVYRILLPIFEGVLQVIANIVKTYEEKRLICAKVNLLLTCHGKTMMQYVSDKVWDEIWGKRSSKNRK